MLMLQFRGYSRKMDDIFKLIESDYKKSTLSHAHLDFLNKKLLVKGIYNLLIGLSNKPFESYDEFRPDIFFFFLCILLNIFFI